MQNVFNVNGAVLTYHLEAMKDLISKTEDGKYQLSEMGAGAIALMERVEELPKTKTPAQSPKKDRRLLFVQSVVVFAAIVLLVSGSYLSSIETVQIYYNLPYESLSVKEPTVIGGNIYDTAINTTVPISRDLLNHGRDEIWVGFKSLENLSSGVYNITVNYLEYTPNSGGYVEKHLGYEGEFIPIENRNGDVFSVLINIPASFNMSSQRQPIPRNIVISVWTNTTQPNPSALMEVKAPISLNEGGYVVTQPYRDQSGVIMEAGIILLVIALTLSVLSLLRKQT
jgi:hypothetical protein